MSLPEPDRTLVRDELGRDPTPAEVALFENLWSEHCAYRSSRPLLSAFESEGSQVVVGPGDDAAVVAVPLSETAETSATERGAEGYSGTYITLGIESHNHPSYVDPYDGAATGVGGIVRDTMSMGAYPIALADSLYFGPFDREHSRYLLEGVVEGIADYGNSIGVPTVAGSVDFHEGYVGNPLVNVACVGLTSADRMVTAEAQSAGNKLVLVGNATGRDGLGGASFASEDLGEDAETEDRPAVQVGDPYTEKLLIEANEALLDENLVVSARDLGAAGLGGASSELVAKGGFGARIELDRVHQREPNMNALEILLAESQERMCYEIRPADVDRVEAIADRYDLGCSVVGEITDGNYVCTFEDEVVVDVDAAFLADGAPMNDLASIEPEQPDRELPNPDLREAFESILAAPNTASKEWIYRQYDHEVGARTAVRPGDDAAVMAIRETADEIGHDHATYPAATGDGTGLAISSGANPNWTSAAPYDGARAIAIENATNLAAKGAVPLAAVDCLNGGNPEKPDVYGGFKAIVDGLAEGCRSLSIPVVGGNVSLYNDSPNGPIPPTPTLSMVGTKSGFDAPPMVASEPDLDVLLVGPDCDALGGSEYLARMGGRDRFPSLPTSSGALVETLAAIANLESTIATHDVSHGGLAVSLAEMVTEAIGFETTVPDRLRLFGETPGRVVVVTTDPEAVRSVAEGTTDVIELGNTTAAGSLQVDCGNESIEFDAERISELRSTIGTGLDG